jgi:hypothetical protein
MFTISKYLFICLLELTFALCVQGALHITAKYGSQRVSLYHPYPSIDALDLTFPVYVHSGFFFFGLKDWFYIILDLQISLKGTK